MSILLPVGTKLFCQVFYKTIYVMGTKIDESNETFKADCLLVGLDMITGPAVAISRIQTAREFMWEDWKKFRKAKEKPKNIDKLVLTHTKYRTNLINEPDLVTEFVDRYIRSIPGYAKVPEKF